MFSRYLRSITIMSVAVSIVSAILLYPSLPDTIASHWNASGEVDGETSKFWGVYLMPLIITALSGLFLILPKIDPLKRNYESFRNEYAQMATVMLVFLIYIQGMIYAWNLGYRFEFTSALFIGIGALLVFIGQVITRTKRNWFMGIRTPWTLSSDYVWNETNRIGGKLFVIAGLITILSNFFLPENYVFPSFIVAIILVVLWTLLYSYHVYRGENNEK